MIRRPPRSTLSSSSAASDVYKRQVSTQSTGKQNSAERASGRGVGMSKIEVPLVTEIIRKACESVLGPQSYDHREVTVWNSQLCEAILKELVGMQQPYKYCVNCLIVQKSGAGLNAASAVHWSGDTDGNASYLYENNSMQCVATVYFLLA
eukprot:TRINITY_DN7695_c0_g1_i5.p1 TRINITY_DN7695_c0_g1~~TRINITY_DN7695_c0_g1_i5.p1  ORF type:complete len:150 (-),score=20.41 TRINITY_DN7695_c0_g1_i5:122-571(-)